MGIRSEYLDLAIAMSTVFFLASLAVSGLQEAVQFPLRVRSKFLWAYLHDLVTVGQKKLPTGIRGILTLWGKSNDVRPPVESEPAEVPVVAGDPKFLKFNTWRTQQPAANALLSGLATALDPIAAPELSDAAGRRRQTTIQHIPAASLAQALVEVFSAGVSEPTVLAEQSIDGGATAERITEALKNLGAAPLGKTARRLWEAAQADVDTFRKNLEGYFDAEMVRLSGYYRRSIRLIVGTLAVLVAVFANIDTFAVTKGLWHNPQGRSALIAQADALVVAPPTSVAGSVADTPLLRQLQQKCQPQPTPQESTEALAKDLERSRACVDDVLTNVTGLGVVDHAIWTGLSKWWGNWTNRSFGGWLLHALGVFVTAVALFLGSSFWFDLIKRLTGIRRGLVGQT
jgi:hypothetical protein